MKSLVVISCRQLLVRSSAALVGLEVGERERERERELEGERERERELEGERERERERKHRFICTWSRMEILHFWVLTLEDTVTCSYHVYVTTIFRRPVCACARVKRRIRVRRW